MKKVVTTFLLCLCVNLPSAFAVEVKLPVPKLETLPNGLQLVWFLSDALPVVDMAMLVKAGNRDDLIGKSGTAELVSDTLERGVGGLSPEEFAHSVEILGASRYASVDEDTFSVGMHGLAPDASQLLELLSKLVLHPDFPEAEVKREHDRMEDRWAHLADSSENLVDLAYRRLLTAGSSYGRGGFASQKEFKNVKREDVLAYYKKYFTPKNTVLMIVGRVDQQTFKKRIEELFGAWQGEAPEHHYIKFEDRRVSASHGQVVLVSRPGLSQAQVRIGMLAPSIHAPEHYSLSVANALLGGYFNSRLNSLIRDKLGLTYGIGSSFAYMKDLSSFGIGAATKNESVGPLIRKTLDVLKDLKKGPIPQDEVATAKTYLIGKFPLSTSTLGAVASRWLAGYIFDLGPDYLNEFVPKVSAVQTGDVLNAVSKDFDLSKLTIVVAGDPDQIKKSLAAAKLGSVKLISAKDLQ